MANPTWWTATHSDDDDSSQHDDEDWTLPPPDPEKEAQIQAAIDAANALKRAKMEQEASFESNDDRRKREREERRKMILARLETTEAENAAPPEASNARPSTPTVQSTNATKQKKLPGAAARCTSAFRA